MTITVPETVDTEPRTADGLRYRSVGELHYLDPRKLVLDEYNVRKKKDTAPDEAMLASVEADGVEIPLIVRPFLDGTYGVLAGQIRMLSAQAAAQKCVDEGREDDILAVPCMVRADLIGQSAEVVAAAVAKSLQENLLRQAMTLPDVVQAAEQLNLLDLDDAALQKAATTAGLTVEQVRNAHKATALPKEVQRKSAQYEFDLEEQIALAEVADVPGAVEDLARARKEDVRSGSKDRGNWQHAMQELLQEKEQRAANAAIRAEWAARGLVEVHKRSWYEPGSTDRLLADLLDGEGRPLDAEQHSAQCPGRAFALDWSGDVVFACADWRANKHKRADLALKPGQLTNAQVAEKNAKEASARGVRGKFVKKLVTEKLSDRAVALTMQVVTEMPSWYAEAVSPGNAKLLAVFFDEPFKAEVYKRPRGFFNGLNARLRRQRRTFNAVFAQVAMGFELHMSRKKHWAVADGWTAEWLRFLKAEGYTLSAIEKEMVAAVEKKEKVEAAKSKSRPSTEAPLPEQPGREDEEEGGPEQAGHDRGDGVQEGPEADGAPSAGAEERADSGLVGHDEVPDGQEDPAPQA
ncbi:ParB/RepB/Spo0J family partition protein [Kitasatospora sp. NPDC002965]|uniref:ParB/RepB/Spo0J family partition protein n=1 Tax=Kitasatospora sp. NPDC002965 TaxID=3154775 RepID=UPI0033BE43A5